MNIGNEVPDFLLETGPGERKDLSEWGDRPIVLVFLRHLA